MKPNDQQIANNISNTLAIPLGVGQTLWVNSARVPAGLAIVGAHYRFVPPYHGRKDPGSTRDLGRLSQVTAIVPLVLSVQGFWCDGPEEMGALSINHVRPARDPMLDFEVAGYKVDWSAPLGKGARNAGKPVDYVEGGPTRAVVYVDEICVANFILQSEGRRGRPMTTPESFILHHTEVDDVTRVFHEANQAQWKERKGIPVNTVIRAHGAVTAHQVGPKKDHQIVVDEAGRVIDLFKFDGTQWVPKSHFPMRGSSGIYRGEMLVNSDMRAALGLEPMPSAAPALRPEQVQALVGAPRPKPQRQRPIANPVLHPEEAAAVVAQAAAITPEETVTAPEVVETTPEVTTPEVTTPEVVEPVAAPEVVEPVAAPEVVETVTAPEVVEPVTTPEVVEPVTTPEVVEPVTAPEVVETTQPEESEEESAEEESEPVVLATCHTPMELATKAASLWELLQGEKATADITTFGDPIIRAGREFRLLHCKRLVQLAGRQSLEFGKGQEHLAEMIQGVMAE